MSFSRRKQNKSKIYAQFIYTLPISNDLQHLNFNDEQQYEEKNILEKKKIDKIMHGTIKERLFSKFTTQDQYMTTFHFVKLQKKCQQKYKTIDLPSQKNTKKGLSFQTMVPLTERFSQQSSRINKLNSTFHFAPLTSRPQKKLKTFNSLNKKHSTFLPELDKIQRGQKLDPTDRGQKSQRLNRGQKYDRLDRNETSKTNKAKALLMFPAKKLQINEKVFSQTFKKWFSNKDTIVYDIKLNQNTIISKFKHVIDPKILERFFYFFNFPQSFSLRHYISLVENAANANLRFIYFWIFIVLDQVSNCVLNYQDLFRFIVTFPQENAYIQEQIYELSYQVKIIQSKFKKNSVQTKDIDIPPEEMLTVNRSLRIEELQDLIKQTTKDRIQVNCIKNTCYHQTILSLQHNTFERFKMNQIEDNKLATESLKIQMLQNKEIMDNIPGIRLRDMANIFNGRRPKIFCYVLHLLAGIKPEDYQ